MIPDYDRKFTKLWRQQGGMCAISGERLEAFRFNFDLHHILADSKVNRKLYPYFIDSLWNLQIVNHGSHMTKPKQKHPPYHVIARAESMLAGDPEVQWRMTFDEAFSELS